MKTLCVLPAAMMLLTGAAAAHDLWLTPGGERLVHVHFGHPDKPEAPSADKLVTLSALSADGAASLSAMPAADGAPILMAALASGRDSLVAASYDNGYWVRLKDGNYRNASKRLLPDGEKSQWSLKFAKAVTGPDAPWDRVLGHTLEIVPLEVPSAASAKIRVRVLFEGSPVSGIAVRASNGAHANHSSDLTGAKTDADGIATVPLRQAGPQLLSVARKVSPSQFPALADTDSYAATFAFTIVDPKSH